MDRALSENIQRPPQAHACLALPWIEWPLGCSVRQLTGGSSREFEAVLNDAMKLLSEGQIQDTGTFLKSDAASLCGFLTPRLTQSGMRGMAEWWCRKLADDDYHECLVQKKAFCDMAEEAVKFPRGEAGAYDLKVPLQRFADQPSTVTNSRIPRSSSPLSTIMVKSR